MAKTKLLEPQAPPSHEDDPLLSPAEVARRLGRHPQTVWNWIREGLVEVVKQPGESIRVRQSVVNRFLRGTNLQKEI